MTLDLLAAIGCAWISFCLFTLFAITNHRHDRWMNMPNYVRYGLIGTGAVFLWRAANLATLPPAAIVMAGHVNLEGIIVMFWLAYTLTAIVVWSGFFKRLPVHGWHRVEFAEKHTREGLVPVMMTPRAVTEMEVDRGFVVDTKVSSRR